MFEWIPSAPMSPKATRIPRAVETSASTMPNKLWKDAMVTTIFTPMAQDTTAQKPLEVIPAEEKKAAPNPRGYSRILGISFARTLVE